MQSNQELFSPYSNGRFHAKNHFARSATKEELCDREGHLCEELYDMYKEFADGDVGTIIVSSARVRLFDHVKSGGLLRLDNPDLIDDYKKLAKVCKSKDATALIQATYTHLNIDQLTLDDFDNIINDFVNGVRFAKEAGFDGIQIHAAHTVGLSYMLSPYRNHRTDEYGKNKNLLALRILKALRDNFEDFIIGFKMNATYEEEGITESDSLKYCIELAEAGCDFIEISDGDPIRNVQSQNEESYNADFACKLSKHIQIPIMLVGGNRSLKTMKGLLGEGIDLFSFSRPLTCEPNLIHRWESGDTLPAKCRFCNACLNTHAHKCIFRK